jgi:hypothetical protein
MKKTSDDSVEFDWDDIELDWSDVEAEVEQQPGEPICWCGSDAIGYDSNNFGYCWKHQPSDQ